MKDNKFDFEYVARMLCLSIVVSLLAGCSSAPPSPEVDTVPFMPDWAKELRGDDVFQGNPNYTAPPAVNSNPNKVEGLSVQRLGPGQRELPDLTSPASSSEPVRSGDAPDRETRLYVKDEARKDVRRDSGELQKGNLDAEQGLWWSDREPGDGMKPVTSKEELYPYLKDLDGSVSDDFPEDLSLLKLQEQQQQEELSKLEKFYAQLDGLSHKRRLRQKVYQTIEQYPKSSDDRGAQSRYELQPGDAIRLVGNTPLDLPERVVVNQNGNIIIPQVGKIQVRGDTEKELNKKVRKALGKQIGDVEVQAAIGKLHPIEVTVTGNVSEPGRKLVSAGSTVLDALARAGGVQKDGTLRNIAVKRDDGSRETVDLYPVVLQDNSARALPVENGDHVVVSNVGATAGLVSPVEKSIFELKEGTTLNEFLAYGGINPSVYKKQVTIEEASGDERTTRTVNREKNGDSIELDDTDIVKLHSPRGDARNKVVLEGPMLRTGTFSYSKGMTVLDLLRRGEGFLLKASLHRALIIRQRKGAVAYDMMPGDKRAKTHKKTIWIDLARLLAGKESENMKLKPLDKLRVLPKNSVGKEPTVEISGAIRQPGTYSLTGRMSLQDLIKMAGGPTSNAYTEKSYIVRRRLLKKAKRFDAALIPFNLQEKMNGEEPIYLKNYDHVVIRSVQRREVSATITGQVRFPGTYILPRGSKITELISAAGGLLRDADLRAAFFSRESVRRNQRKRVRQYFRETEERFSNRRNIVTRDESARESVANHLALLGLGRLAENMREFDVNGRTVIDFLREDFPSSNHNLKLEENDRLHIPRREDTVTVIGEVYSPRAFIWSRGENVDYYLNQAGGLKDRASSEETFVMMASGEVRSASQIGYDRLQDLELGPGDSILVPPKEMGESPFSFENGLTVARRLVEIGAIGASIPGLLDADRSEVNLDVRDQEEPANKADPYDRMIQNEDEKRLRSENEKLRRRLRELRQIKNRRRENSRSFPESESNQNE